MWTSHFLGQKKMNVSLIRSAANVQTVEEFKQWTRIHIRPILPHQTFSCGYGHIHAGGVALDGVVAVDYPLDHLDTIRNRIGGIDTPILRRWLATREPQLFDPDQPWSDIPQAWFDSYCQHQLGRTVAHAVYDTERCVGTYHSFHRVEEPLGERHVSIARELVPVMHEVFCRVIEQLNATNEFATQLAGLSQPEREVVNWLKVGKTNQDIAQLLGCTEGAVKQRLKRMFEKLGIENRAQLVCRLVEHENQRPLGYGTKYL